MSGLLRINSCLLYTSYEMTEGDYLVNNEAKTEDDVALATVYDNKMRNEIFIKLPVTSLAAVSYTHLYPQQFGYHFHGHSFSARSIV